MRRLLLVALLLAVSASANPYYDATVALPDAYLEGGCRKPGRNPMPKAIEKIRDQLMAQYSWAIPTPHAIERIHDFAGGRIVDFGAGTGFWAHLLAEAGSDVVAIDDWSWGKPAHLFHPVSTGTYSALKEHRTRTLLMVWPPRNEMPLIAMRAWGGDRMVYVGEILRGSGNVPFYERLDSEWVLVDQIGIPQWWNRSDAVYLLARGPARPWVNAEVTECML